MPARCQICTSPYLQQISDLIDSNTLTLKQIAEQFSVSVFSLSRHCARHRNPAPAAGSVGADIETWLSRANDEYLLARADDDSRGAVAALIAGLRATESKMKALERKAEQQEEAGEEEDFRFPISDLDGVTQLLTQTPVDPVDQEKLKLALEKCRLLNRPDLLVVFWKAYEDPVFASELSSWTAMWQSAKDKGEPDAIPQETARAN